MNQHMLFVFLYEAALSRSLAVITILITFLSVNVQIWSEKIKIFNLINEKCNQLIMINSDCD